MFQSRLPSWIVIAGKSQQRAKHPATQLFPATGQPKLRPLGSSRLKPAFASLYHPGECYVPALAPTHQPSIRSCIQSSVPLLLHWDQGCCLVKSRFVIAGLENKGRLTQPQAQFTHTALRTKLPSTLHPSVKTFFSSTHSLCHPSVHPSASATFHSLTLVAYPLTLLRRTRQSLVYQSNTALSSKAQSVTVLSCKTRPCPEHPTQTL